MHAHTTNNSHTHTLSHTPHHTHTHTQYLSSLGVVCYTRFYTEDAAEMNDGYRAAGFTIELRDTGQYGFLLPPDQVPGPVLTIPIPHTAWQ